MNFKLNIKNDNDSKKDEFCIKDYKKVKKDDPDKDDTIDPKIANEY